MKRIWILTELYFPEQTSTGYFLTKTAEGLTQNYHVKVITGAATVSLQLVEYPNYQIINKVEIFRCQGTNFDKNWLLGRVINGFTRSVVIFWKALTICRSEDIILVVTNPPLLPFITLFLKWLKGCEFVLLVHDVYPEALVAAGLTKESSFVSKLFQLANAVLYQQAARVITLGRDMTKLTYSKLTPRQQNKVKCIPNWADIELVNPTERSSNLLLQELGVTDRFAILYAGNMGRTHDIESLAKAAEILQQHNTPIHFIFIGTGAKKKWLAEFVKTKNLSNVSILSFRPNSEKVISLTACDVAVISFMPGMSGVSVPSRMYNQMAAGKPIIAIADSCSELAQVIQEEQVGWVVQPGDVEGFVDTIKLAAVNPELCEQMGTIAAQVARIKYSFAQADQAYKKLFSELV